MPVHVQHSMIPLCHKNENAILTWNEDNSWVILWGYGQTNYAYHRTQPLCF